MHAFWLSIMRLFDCTINKYHCVITWVFHSKKKNDLKVNRIDEIVDFIVGLESSDRALNTCTNSIQ